MKNKIGYKSITVKNISAHNDSKIIFDKNSKVTPIIGLNGSGKSIFLNILSNLFNDSFDEKDEQKFQQKDKTNKRQFILIEPEGKISLNSSTNKYSTLLSEHFGISVSLNKKIFFVKILHSFNRSIKKFYFFPSIIDDIPEIKRRLENIFNNLNKKDIELISKETQKIIQNNLMNFELLSLSKDGNSFLKSSEDKTRNIIKNNKSIKNEVYIKILDKIEPDWLSKCKLHIKNIEKHKSGIEGSEVINLVNSLNEKINNELTGEYKGDEMRNELENIFNNLSGREFDPQSAKPIRTTPSMKITLNCENEKWDLDIIMSFNERDINNELVDFPAKDKNDGFNLVFWYIVYTKFILESPPNTYIMIDEFGNFLNPKVIDSLINIFLLSEHRTIYTTHNPYAFKLKLLNSTHISMRNQVNNYSQLKHLEENVKLEIMNKKNRNENLTYKIICDSLAVNEELLEWKIRDDKLNLLVEGLSDVLAFKIFDQGKKLWPLIMNGCYGTYKQISKLYCLNLDSKINYLSLVDSDWVRNETGAKNINGTELSIYNKYIFKINEIYNDYEDLEDIFLSSKLIFIDEFKKKNNIEDINKIKKIKNNKIKTEVKEIILSELLKIHTFSKEQITKMDQEYENIFAKFDNFITKLLEKVI